jgi:hypothetical protein
MVKHLPLGIKATCHGKQVGLYIPVTKYKGLEMEVFWFGGGYSCISLWFRRKQDHPGISLNVDLFGVGFNVDFYDGRHWDDNKKCLISEVASAPSNNP